VPEHLSPEEIDRFAARKMAAAEAAAARRHLFDCAACRERLRASPAYPERGRREAELVASLEERAGCPEPRTKAALVSGALSAERRAEVAAHVRRCRACARDVRALEGLRAGVTGRRAAGQPNGEPGAARAGRAGQDARGPGCLLWFLRR
jgi:anti-sigma factor RsiW